MSGGSYEYLCYADNLHELSAKNGPLREMVDRLSGLGYAMDAAMETQALLLDIRAADVRARAAHTRLNEVWGAVEWWDSCDSSEQGVKDALVKYRGLASPPSQYGDSDRPQRPETSTEAAKDSAP